MPASKHLTLVRSRVVVHPALERPRCSLESFERLQGGWHPGKGLLANAQHAEQWTVRCQPDAHLYQFVGYVTQVADRTSIIIATVLAIDPQAGWVLLTNDRWMTLGRQLPETVAFDPSEVARGAGKWLGCGVQDEA